MKTSDANPLLYQIALIYEFYDRKVAYSVFAADAAEAIKTATMHALTEHGSVQFKSAEQIVPRWVNTEAGFNNTVVSRSAYEFFGRKLAEAETAMEAANSKCWLPHNEQKRPTS